jgi:hypothetical protein
MSCETFPLSCKTERFWYCRKMTTKNRKWPRKANFDVFLLKYLSDWNKTFTTLILHIGLHSDKVWRILNFLILYVLPDYYRQPLFNCVVICVHPFIARTSAKSSRFVRVNKHSRHCWVLTQLCHCINICSLLCSTPERIIWDNRTCDSCVKYW